MNSLIIGVGEIGRAVRSVVSKAVNPDKVTSYDLIDGSLPSITNPDILHICFPYSNGFVDDVQGYIEQFKPWHVIIWSTVAIGTTKKIKGAVHSPVEGRHPYLDLSIRSMTRWIGFNNEGEGDFFADYFKGLYLRTCCVSNSDFTEFLKLRSTARYGINLAFADYESRTAHKIGMDYALVKEFDQDYNKLYHNLGMNWAQRYILDPPRGKIGGHCIVPNADLLDEQFPNEMLKIIRRFK